MIKLTNPCSEIPLGSIGGITCSPDMSDLFEPGERPRRGDIFVCYEDVFVASIWVRKNDRIMITDIDHRVVCVLINGLHVKISIYALFEFFDALVKARR